MNCFISIIEEAYASSKEMNKDNWIYSYLKIDPRYVQIKDLEDKENQKNSINNIQPVRNKHSSSISLGTSRRNESDISPSRVKGLIREIGIKGSGNQEKIKEDIVKHLNSLFGYVDRF
jgi:hypothetical protein